MKARFIATVFAAFYVLSGNAQTFEPEVFVGPGSESFTSYHWADFNADGAFDILEVDIYSKATMHISDGVNFNSTHLDFEALHFSEERFAFNDYDGDGDVDMLATQGTSIVIVNYDGGDGFTLVNTGINFTYSDNGKIYWLDLDGDLVLDIIHGRRIFLNRKGVYVESPVLLVEFISNMVIDDVNSDGLPDIVAAGYESYDGTDVSIFINEGEGHFKQTSAPTLPAAKLKSNTIALLDVDGDSDIDVFGMDLYARGWIFKNSLAQTGQMSFTGVQIFSDISLFHAVAGDVNSDGLQDLVVAGPASLTLLKNKSTGTTISFTQEAYALQLDTFHNIDLVDINGDNKLDAHIKGYFHQTGTVNLIFENTSALTGVAPSAPSNLLSIVEKNVSMSWNAIPGLLYNIEVKRDGTVYKPSGTSASGRLLLTSGNFLLEDGSLQLRGLPAGSYEWRVQAVNPSGRSSPFSTANSFDISSGPSSLTLEASDLINVKLCWSYAGADNPAFKVFRVTSSGAATEIAHVGAGTTCYEDSAAPENQRIEYFVVAVNGVRFSERSNTVVHHSSLFVESPFGTAEPNIISSRTFPADYDNDGDYDLEFIGRVGNFDNNFLLKNNGAGSFNPQGPMLTATSFLLPNTEMTGPRDVDNDGDPDMVLITGENYSWQKVSVFINNEGTFTTGFETPAYLGISQLAVEDLNNDGRVDLLFSHTVGNSSGNPHNYQLLYQTIDGSFKDSRITFSNTETSTLSFFRCEDLNSDGYLDMLWISSDEKYSDILINEKGTGFSRKTSILPVTYSMGVEDYSGDGIVDVMVIGNEGLNLYFGAGNFTFTEPKVIPIDYLSGGSTFVHADVDLNGWADLLLSDGYNSQVILNRGNGSFKSSNVKLQGNWGSSIAVVDLENDGDIDIVKTGNDGQHQGLNYVYRNQLADINIVNEPPTAPGALAVTHELGETTCTWSASTDDLTPAKLLTYNISIMDSNDKVWVSPETNESGTFRRRMAPGNTGYSTVKTLNDLPVGLYRVRVQAIDASFALSSWSQEIQLTIHEGPTVLAIERVHLNKVTLTWKNSAFSETNVVVQRRMHETTWEVAAELPPGTASYSDDNLEYNKLYEYRVFETSGTATTASSNIAEWSTKMWVMEDTDLPNLYGSMDVADFTGDGLMDMVMNGGMIYNGNTEDITRATFENTPAGWIKNDITPSQLTHTAKIAFTDLNGDYKPDIYQHGNVWESGYQTETFINTGNKTFSSSTNGFTSEKYAIQSYFDFDMDNDLDISVVKAESYPRVGETLRNNGEGNYTSTGTSTCNSCPQNVAVADFDRDGDEDVIRYANWNYELYLNGPSGLLPTGGVFAGSESRIVVTDYNSDGFPDVAVLTSSSYQRGKLYKNLGLESDGTNMFKELSVNFSSGEQSFLSADFNHDGHTDLVVLSPKVQVLLNKGDDTFDEYIEPGFRLSLNSAGMLDFDNDGDLDIYLSGYYNTNSSDYGRKAKILLNQTIVSAKGVSNAPPEAPYNLSSTQDSLGVHLKWSTPNDDHTQSQGITYDVVLIRDGKIISKGYHDPSTGSRVRLAPGRSTGVSTLTNLMVGPYLWRVQAIDGSFAASNFSTEQTFVFLPPPPVIKDTLIYACGRTVTLTAKGNDIKWYRDKELTELIASGEFHPVETQTVYVVQTVDGYRGTPKRLRITIHEKPPMPVLTQPNPYIFCQDFSTLWVPGDDVRWYSDKSLTKLVSSTNELQVSSNATYYVTQAVQGCSSEALTIEVQKTTVDRRIYATEDRIYTRETNAEGYYWIRNGLYFQYTTVPYIPFDGQIATYVVSILKGQCQIYSNPFITTENNITALEEIPESIIVIYPNPATSTVTIKVKQTNTAINIFDTRGKLVYSAVLDRGSEQVINTSEWTKGVYMLVLAEGEKLYTKRLVLF